jgi:hypothetical protein
MVITGNSNPGQIEREKSGEAKEKTKCAGARPRGHKLRLPGRRQLVPGTADLEWRGHAPFRSAFELKLAATLGAQNFQWQLKPRAA